MKNKNRNFNYYAIYVKYFILDFIVCEQFRWVADETILKSIQYQKELFKCSQKQYDYTLRDSVNWILCLI